VSSFGEPYCVNRCEPYASLAFPPQSLVYYHPAHSGFAVDGIGTDGGVSGAEFAGEYPPIGNPGASQSGIVSHEYGGSVGSIVD